MDADYTLRIFHGADALAEAAAKLIVSLSEKAIAERGKFCMALSGGKTPLRLYTLLTSSPYKEQVHWEKTFIFWGDERCVPLEDERNNAHEALSVLGNVFIPPDNIYRIPVNLAPATAAMAYEKEIFSFFGDEAPRFDLVLLGLGENGHTASLFPESEVLQENVPGITEVYVEEQNMFRVTMNAPLINAARTILFLVTGIEKAAIVKTLFTTSLVSMRYPAQLIRPENGELFWFLDEAAAAEIR